MKTAMNQREHLDSLGLSYTTAQVVNNHFYLFRSTGEIRALTDEGKIRELEAALLHSGRKLLTDPERWQENGEVFDQFWDDAQPVDRQKYERWRGNQ